MQKLIELSKATQLREPGLGSRQSDSVLTLFCLHPPPDDIGQVPSLRLGAKDCMRPCICP